MGRMTNGGATLKKKKNPNDESQTKEWGEEKKNQLNKSEDGLFRT